MADWALPGIANSVNPVGNDAHEKKHGSLKLSAEDFRKITSECFDVRNTSNETINLFDAATG